ncbi:MAG: hypothetical protein OSB00_09415, partial [Sphingomonas bacterium]|nr:hypothetical protein [Sphingomonas bacterium]
KKIDLLSKDADKGEYVFKTKTVADLGDEYEGQIMSGNRDGAAGGGGGGGVPQAFIDAVKKRFDAQAAALDLAAKAALETQRRLDRLEAFLEQVDLQRLRVVAQLRNLRLQFTDPLIGLFHPYPLFDCVDAVGFCDEFL